MNNEELLNAVIKKYKLADPVPAEVRMAMEKSRRAGLSNILRRDAAAALVTTAAVSLFLWIKKFGISVSMIKSTVAVSAAVTIGAGTITAAGVYGTIKVTRYLSSPGTRTETGKVTGLETATLQDKTTGSPPGIIYYDLAVSRVEMDDVEPEVLREYTGIVIKELCKVKGEKAAIGIDMLDSSHKANRILDLSIIKLDQNMNSTYRVSAKIINSTNSQVLRHVSETVNSEKGIPVTLRSLALKVTAGP